MNWINANKQFPDDGKEYLVYFPDAHQTHSGMWVCKAWVYGRDYEPKRGMWSVPDGRGGYYAGDNDPSDVPMRGTFWMPLPEAPKQ